MSENIATTTTDAPTVSAPETTTPDLADAVRRFLRTEGKVWADLVDACVTIAEADAASDLGETAKAKLAAGVSLAAGKLVGVKVYRSMTASTYSKRVKVGRFAHRICPPELVAKYVPDWSDANAAVEHPKMALTYGDVFELVCDTPSLDKFYEWLPREVGKGGRPKGSTSKPKTTPAAEVSVPETPAEPVAPFRWDSAHVATAAKAILESLRAQGADDATVRLVMTEVGRLATPVRSVTNAA